jgi:hypothetical protein
MNGHCIAGIDIDSGEWVRPVSAYSYGELGSREITVRDHETQIPRLMRPLDVVHLGLDRQAGHVGQPENWILKPRPGALPQAVLNQGANDESTCKRVRSLAEQSSSWSLLLGTLGKEISHKQIEKDPISQSLCVIRPKNLTWVRSTKFNSNQPRIEGWFDFGGRNIRYYLSLTDIAWEAKLLELTTDSHTLDASAVPGAEAHLEILLTISLGDLFDKTGCHYKLIAGVLLLPEK